MFFDDLVEIKQSEYCPKCFSFEYDLPCRVDEDLIKAVFNLKVFDGLKKDTTYQAIRIEIEDIVKIDAILGTRYFILYLPKTDIGLKKEVDLLIANWASKKLDIEMEMKND